MHCKKYLYYKINKLHRAVWLVSFLVVNKPLSEHEGRFGFGLIIGGRRAADDNGSSTVTTQRVLQDTGHLAVSVGDVGLVYTKAYTGTFNEKSTK